MENFMEAMGYGCPEAGWREQVKLFAQLVVFGAIAFVPMAALMALVGWLERFCE